MEGRILEASRSRLWPAQSVLSIALCNSHATFKQMRTPKNKIGSGSDKVDEIGGLLLLVMLNAAKKKMSRRNG